MFKYVIHDDMIYRECVKGTKSTPLGRKTLVIPVKYRDYIIQLAHDSVFAGHFSVRKTELKILDKFYWPKAYAEITRYCQSCDICQKTVSRGNVKPVPLYRATIISEPFSQMTMDIIGPISPPSDEGHRFILTIIDMATKFPDAVPMKNIDTISVAEALLTVFSRVGIPKKF